MSGSFEGCGATCVAAGLAASGQHRTPQDLDRHGFWRVGKSDVFKLDVHVIERVDQKVGPFSCPELGLLHVDASTRLVGVLHDDARAPSLAIDLNFSQRRFAGSHDSYHRSCTGSGPAKDGSVTVADQL